MNRLSMVIQGMCFLLFVLIFPAVGYSVDTDIIINEIYYYPNSDLQNEEYVELYNRGETSVDLTGWAFSRGISFLFPDGTMLPPHAYLVVARDASKARTFAQTTAVLGDYEGRLSDNGETLTLYNGEGDVADSVRYGDSTPWPTAPDGTGPSLERICPWESSDDPYNWATAEFTLTSSGRPTGKFRTPGRQNSVYSDNLPPTVYGVNWEPSCPQPEIDVLVTVRVKDADGVESVRLHYQPVSRRQSTSAERTLVMRRVEGSETDGEWSVEIPGQPDRTFVRFWIEAADSLGNVRDCPANTESRRTFTYFHYADDASSTIPIAFLYDFGAGDNPDAFRNDSAFVIRYPNRVGWEVYDYINTTKRSRSGDGYDIRFVKHYELDDMSGINVSFEVKPRYLLSEWLSYKIYQSLGTIAGKVDHYRFIRNDKDYGYYLMYEQPNKHFIARNGLNNEGNLYKIHWSYDRSTTASQISQLHEKRTHLSTGKDDIIETIQALHTLSGRDQTLYMESYCALDQFINYYVGCQLISDWDGYFNNHYVYHDTESSGLWYVFPWDKDKTWGDSDAYRNILPYYDFYDFPILFGSYSAPQSGKDNGTWWRPAGYFSGPILDNPDMQLRYLYRLGYVAKHEFTEENWIPVIDALDERLEPEIRHKAQISGVSENSLVNEFRTEIESLRRQVINRRLFILQETEKLIGPVRINDWTAY